MYNYSYLDLGEAVKEVVKGKAPRTENAMVCETHNTAPCCATFMQCFNIHLFLFLNRVSRYPNTVIYVFLNLHIGKCRCNIYILKIFCFLYR